MARSVRQVFESGSDGIFGSGTTLHQDLGGLGAGETVTRIVGRVGTAFRSEVQDAHLGRVLHALYVRSSALSSVSSGSLTSNAAAVKWVDAHVPTSGGWFVQDVTNWNPAGFWYSSASGVIDVQGQALAATGDRLWLSSRGLDLGGVSTGYWIWWVIRAFVLQP